MPKISQEKIQKIKEQILFYLYSIFPKQVFTSDIAREIARDEEFVKKLLIDLQKDRWIIQIQKNPKGTKYFQRLRWRISNQTHKAYSKHQK